jgi:hypothetical protein
MYTDSYDKRVDENIKIAEIIRIKNENNFDEYKVSIDTIM